MRCQKWTVPKVKTYKLRGEEVIKIADLEALGLRFDRSKMTAMVREAPRPHRLTPKQTPLFGGSLNENIVWHCWSKPAVAMLY